jgi:hypothetical protein
MFTANFRLVISLHKNPQDTPSHPAPQDASSDIRKAVRPTLVPETPPMAPETPAMEWIGDTAVAPMPLHQVSDLLNKWPHLAPYIRKAVESRGDPFAPEWMECTTDHDVLVAMKAHARDIEQEQQKAAKTPTPAFEIPGSELPDRAFAL